MLGRDLGLEREVELAHAPALTPLAQMVTKFRPQYHAATLADAPADFHYLRRNRHAAIAPSCRQRAVAAARAKGKIMTISDVANP